MSSVYDVSWLSRPWPERVCINLGGREMSSVYELSRSGPDREEGIRQLITNLQAQNRQLAADRDSYASEMVKARAEAERLRIALKRLWDTYLPSWAPGAALAVEDGLHPAWRTVAECLVSPWPDE